MSQKREHHKEKPIRPELPVIYAVKKNYATAPDYDIYRLTNKSTKQDETVSSYIAKMIKKFKSAMKAYFFDPKKPTVHDR